MLAGNIPPEHWAKEFEINHPERKRSCGQFYYGN